MFGNNNNNNSSTSLFGGGSGGTSQLCASIIASYLVLLILAFARPPVGNMATSHFLSRALNARDTASLTVILRACFPSRP